MIAILAPGQGAQKPGMLAPWLDRPGARELLERFSEAGGLDLVHAGTEADAATIEDTAVTQPLRVEVFDDGGYSLPEVGTAAVTGGLPGGVVGGALGGAAAAPIARTAAGELSGLRTPGGVIRAALDPPNRGPQHRRFKIGVHEGRGATFEPHELNRAELLAGEGNSVHARPIIGTRDVTNPDALVRTGPQDPGTYTEFKQPKRLFDLDPDDPTDNDIFDPYPLFWNILTGPRRDGSLARRAARAVFQRLVDARLGWPMVLTHNSGELIATFDQERGVRNFPPGTRTDGVDKHIWG